MEFRVEVSIKRDDREMGYNLMVVNARNPRAAANRATKSADVRENETISQIRVYELIREDGYFFKGEHLLTV